MKKTNQIDSDACESQNLRALPQSFTFSKPVTVTNRYFVIVFNCVPLTHANIRRSRIPTMFDSNNCIDALVENRGGITLVVTED